MLVDPCKFRIEISTMYEVTIINNNDLMSILGDKSSFCIYFPIFSHSFMFKLLQSFALCASVLSCVRLLARLLCSWNLPSKNAGVGCHYLLQGIFPTEGSNLHPLRLLHWQMDSLPLVLDEKPSFALHMSLING